MKMTRWKDLKHKASPAKRARIKREALSELDRIGYGALRKARLLTQTELAKKLNISQASVAALEARTDLHLSTLAKYIQALGGELQIKAVFPEGTFNLEPPSVEIPAVKAKVKSSSAKRT